MTNELSPHFFNDVMRQFEAGLAKVKYEFQKNLHNADSLDRDALKERLLILLDMNKILSANELTKLNEFRKNLAQAHT